eukprot:CAMPEP_0172315962 /NCGR_PEP_ID=MMETSP1058-20130122/26807_1 /TAXON_ID=83371 /ORGANISM="Detonula confervacea, Strain CCMP 353" /LENGTH=220 /DNA_ID=CAMNT_0013030171 /DNA_START=43 /DNA_END=705 /DNA_ORIENTATION=+
MTKANDSEWSTVAASGRRSMKRNHPDNDNDGGDAVVYSPLSRQSPQQGGERAFRPFVLVLVGIPGSGKSNFASRLEKSSMFLRINQDSLGTRRKCEALARRALAEGKVAVIDRCNFDLEQRSTWIAIAREKGVHCECIIFDYDKDVCITRCKQRKGHETLHPSKAPGVVSLLAKKFRPPVSRGRNGGNVQCLGGEAFRRLERVSSFNMADNLAESYLKQR